VRLSTITLISTPAVNTRYPIPNTSPQNGRDKKRFPSNVLADSDSRLQETISPHHRHIHHAHAPPRAGRSRAWQRTDSRFKVQDQTDQCQSPEALACHEKAPSSTNNPEKGGDFPPPSYPIGGKRLHTSYNVKPVWTDESPNTLVVNVCSGMTSAR